MARNEQPGSTVTIVDVAREAGVSYATVSRVINNKEHVRPDKREAVLRAMSRLGYVANLQARSLAGGRSRVVGVLVQDLSTSYTGAVILGVDEALDAAQYDLMLYTSHRRKTRESAYVGALTRGLADGILLILPTNADAYLEGLQRQGFPYMLVDHQGSGDYRRSVRSTNHQGAFDAVRHLIDIGHRRIGHITGELSVGAASDRLAGYRAALMMAGLPVDPALVVPGNFHQTTGYSGAQALLSLPEPPTAIFVGNDHMAFGVMEAARVRGLRIPEDLSIIGFDDIPQALIVHPPLTTVKQPLEQMGRVAAETLLRLIDGDEDVVTQVVLPTELILRYTCCPPAAAPPQGG